MSAAPGDLTPSWQGGSKAAAPTRHVPAPRGSLAEQITRWDPAGMATAQAAGLPLPGQSETAAPADRAPAPSGSRCRGIPGDLAGDPWGSGEQPFGRADHSVTRRSRPRAVPGQISPGLGSRGGSAPQEGAASGQPGFPDDPEGLRSSRDPAGAPQSGQQPGGRPTRSPLSGCGAAAPALSRSLSRRIPRRSPGGGFGGRGAEPGSSRDPARLA